MRLGFQDPEVLHSPLPVFHRPVAAEAEPLAMRPRDPDRVVLNVEPPRKFLEPVRDTHTHHKHRHSTHIRTAHHPQHTASTPAGVHARARKGTNNGSTPKFIEEAILRGKLFRLLLHKQRRTELSSKKISNFPTFCTWGGG